MDTFKRLREIEEEGPPRLPYNSDARDALITFIWREKLKIAWGRLFWARAAIAGWGLAFVFIITHYF